MTAVRVYFARATDGRPRGDVLDDARSVEAVLASAGLELVDPYALCRAVLGDNPSPTEIVEFDLGVLGSCQALLMDMTQAHHRYIGCICELTYAHVWDLRSAVYVHDNTLAHRPWLRYHADRICESLEEAVSYLAMQLKGSGGSTP